MSLNLNQVLIAGRMTRDVELRPVGATQVGSFGVAINHSWVDKATGDKKEEVTFLDVDAWGKTADFVKKYFAKGAAVFVQGRLKLETWADADGTKRSKVKVVAEDVRFVESAGDKSAPPKAAASGSAKAPTDDQVPF